MKGFSKTQYPNLLRNDASGVYYVQARTGNGGRKAASLKTDLLSVAKLRLPLALARVRAEAGRLHGGKLTLAEGAAIYLDNKRKLGRKGKLLKASSIGYREWTIEAIRGLWPGFDETRIAAVTPAMCQDWAKRARAKYSSVQFNGQYQSLHGIFEVAIDLDEIQISPMRRIEPARVVVKEKVIPTREQFTAILLALDSHPKRKFAALSLRALAFTGLRPKEARNLTVEDYDAVNHTLTARVTKNGDPRTIELIAQAVELFEADLPGVIAALKKSPKKALNTVCRDLEYQHMSPYFMRHMHLTRLLECGVDIIAAASAAGHRDRGKTLLKHYAKQRPEHVREQIGKVFI